jgi:hypothetical protein
VRIKCGAKWGLVVSLVVLVVLFPLIVVIT